jgi:hypothetical protein
MRPLEALLCAADIISLSLSAFNAGLPRENLIESSASYDLYPQSESFLISGLALDGTGSPRYCKGRTAGF